jgi:hypothetical protein
MTERSLILLEGDDVREQYDVLGRDRFYRYLLQQLNLTTT